MIIITGFTAHTTQTAAGVLAIWWYNDLLLPWCTMSSHLKLMRHACCRLGRLLFSSIKHQFLKCIQDGDCFSLCKP